MREEYNPTDAFERLKENLFTRVENLDENSTT